LKFYVNKTYRAETETIPRRWSVETKTRPLEWRYRDETETFETETETTILWYGIPCLHHSIAWHAIFAGDSSWTHCCRMLTFASARLSCC